MQLQGAALALLALLVAPGSAAVLGRMGLRAQSTYARNWLRAHPAPQQDELSELKSANPEAYAIVKALLMKRSLGLLDPKHPTASFAAPPPPKDGDEAPASGANVFAAFATPPPSAAAAVPSNAAYPEVAAVAPPAHHDWLNWKPQDSAVDDEAMVKNVLGSVAGLVASKGSPPTAAQPADSAANVVAAVAAPAAPAATSSGAAAGGGWGDVFQSMQGAQAGLGGKPLKPITQEPAPQAAEEVATFAAAPAAEDNSVFKGLDFKSDFADAPNKDGSQSALSSFSWGEDAPKEDVAPAQTPAAAPAQTPAAAPQPPSPPQQEATPATPVEEAAATPTAEKPAATAAPKEKKNSLLLWLGGGGAALRPAGQEAEAAPQHQERKATTPAPAEQNPYLAMMN